MRLSMLFLVLICAACSQHPAATVSGTGAGLSVAALSGSWQRTVTDDAGSVAVVTLVQFDDGTYRLERSLQRQRTAIEPDAEFPAQPAIELGLWGVSGAILFHTFQGRLTAAGQFVPVRQDDPERFNAYSVERVDEVTLLLKHVSGDQTEVFGRLGADELLVSTP